MINDVIVDILRSDGQRLIIGGDNSDWMILSDGLTGIDYPTTNLYSEKNAVGDGMYISGKDIESRIVTLKAVVKNKKINSILRKNVSSFFNPKYQFEVTVTYQNSSKWFIGELDGFKIKTENMYMANEFIATFFCAHPFLKSTNPYVENISEIEPKWGFPYIDTSSIKPKTSVYKFNKITEIINDGDIETYCLVIIVAKNEVVNPKIVKDNKYVRILDTLISGDIVLLDFENMTITKNGNNIINLIDRNSSFSSMKLDVGKSLIGFDADNGDNNMDVAIYYNKLYMGI